MVRSAFRVTVFSAVLLGVGFAALTVMVGLTFNLAQQTKSDLGSAVRASEIATAAVDLRSGLQSAEASQRGFLANGNEVYLAPYSTAKSMAFARLNALTEELATGSEADPQVTHLAGLVQSKFAEMDETIRLKRARQDEAAMTILRTNKGKALMDEANVFLSSIIRHANQDVAANVARQNDGLQRLSRIIFAAALLVLLVVATTLWMISRFVRNVRQAQQEVTELNASLEQRVKDRTVELTAARDRAELLLAEVNHRVANSLALVASMVRLQGRATTSAGARAALSETENRINAVALVHKKLYTSGDVQTVALGDFLPILLQQLEESMRETGNTSVLKPDIRPLSLPTDKSVSLGIIAAEWVTNAFKYAYPGTSGEIRVSLSECGDGLAELRVEDDGIGRDADAAPKGTGMGTKLVTALASSLGGRVEYDRRARGTSARLILPAA